MSEQGFKLTSGVRRGRDLRLALVDRHDCAEVLDIATNVAASEYGRRVASWRVLVRDDLGCLARRPRSVPRS